MTNKSKHEKENQSGRLSEIFYGWYIVGGVLVCLSVSTGIFLVFTFGVFIKPISDSLGASRGDVSLGLTIATVVGLVAMPTVGRLIDRFGAIRVILPSTVALSLLLGSMYWVSSIIVFYIICGLMNSLAAGASPVGYATLIVRWFDRQRGIALGISLSGLGLGAAIMPRLAQDLINSYGWNVAFVFLGAVCFVVTVPTVLFVLRESPRSMGLAPDGMKMDSDASNVSFSQSGLSLNSVIRGRQFWLLATAFFLTACIIPGTLIHLVPMLTDRGFSSIEAASYASITGLSLILGRLISGYLLDHVFAPYIAVIFWLLPAFGIYVFATGSSDHLLILASISLGLSLGAEFDLIAFFVGRYFGVKHYASIYGVMFSIFSLGAGVGPAVIGYLYDNLESYVFLPWAYVFCVTLSCGCVLLLGRYPKWG